MQFWDFTLESIQSRYFLPERAGSFLSLASARDCSSYVSLINRNRWNLLELFAFARDEFRSLHVDLCANESISNGEPDDKRRTEFIMLGHSTAGSGGGGRGRDVAFPEKKG